MTGKLKENQKAYSKWAPQIQAVFWKRLLKKKLHREFSLNPGLKLTSFWTTRPWTLSYTRKWNLNQNYKK